MKSKFPFPFSVSLKRSLIVLTISVLPLFSLAKRVDSRSSSVSKRDLGFPKECIQFALKESFPRIAVGEKSRLFVKCSAEQNEPVSGQARPKYTDSDITNLTRAFDAITDCLDIDAQWMFPKIVMESGFHTTIQNPNGDAGIGQLTAHAIEDVDEVLPEYKEMIYSSKKKSCRWIKTMTQNRANFWKPVLGKSKCTLMSKSANPIRNLLYTAIFSSLNEEYVSEEFDKRNIQGLLEEAGMPLQDTTTLKRILITLGYNTGGKTAVRNLQDFLFSRIDYIKRKSQEFSTKSLDSMTDAERATALAYVTAKDFDFTTGLTEFNKKKSEMKQKVSQTNSELSDEQIEQAAQRLMRNVSASLYSFPEWLKVWQSHGGPGYVSNIAVMSLRLENNFGPGKCSDTTNYKLEDESVTNTVTRR